MLRQVIQRHTIRHAVSLRQSQFDLLVLPARLGSIRTQRPCSSSLMIRHKPNSNQPTPIPTTESAVRRPEPASSDAGSVANACPRIQHPETKKQNKESPLDPKYEATNLLADQRLLLAWCLKAARELKALCKILDNISNPDAAGKFLDDMEVICMEVKRQRQDNPTIEGLLMLIRELRPLVNERVESLLKHPDTGRTDWGRTVLYNALLNIFPF